MQIIHGFPVNKHKQRETASVTDPHCHLFRSITPTPLTADAVEVGEKPLLSETNNADVPDFGLVNCQTPACCIPNHSFRVIHLVVTAPSNIVRTVWTTCSITRLSSTAANVNYLEADLMAANHCFGGEYRCHRRRPNSLYWDQQNGSPIHRQPFEWRRA